MTTAVADRPNRATRRNAKRRPNHNVFTKKYKSERAKDAAVELLVGSEAFADMKRKVRAKKKADMEKKNANRKA
jgi:hypothetical protein